MPIYTYQCRACEAIFEEYQKISDKPLKKCSECKKNKLEKIVSLPARPIVPESPFEQYKKIKQEAKQIAQRIVKGDQEAIADIYGDAVASGKPIPKQVKQPKKLKDVKGKTPFKRKDT